ncbi:permease [Peloplasma aerotolerans]|uniref:Permease n=1 Tax=Peloplasma aerotolerans TaxID=3044389 RepID=A0AAW6UB58_9MOLU|nr:permease [Mariniplasma sp. M4Ah]MDI6453199.1 permease [Mariniplasma sp. M4Ah]MDR4968113.1 permease [Acholeplasmataceae bacterium]
MQYIKNIFVWLNDQFLKMVWLDDLVKWFFGDVIKMDKESLLFSSVSFFVYDVIKILLLLSVLIFIASYLQSFFSAERTRRILKGKTGIGANATGALLGTVTPFCSCSSIPIFIGFTKAGLPIGVTFSFLISSPLVDLASVILLASIFNWTVAIAYVVVGLIIAVIGGTLISFFKMERYVESFVLETRNQEDTELEYEEEVMTKRQRVGYSIDQVKMIIKRVWLYIIIGVGIGAVIHGYIPEEMISAILGQDNAFSVVIATIIGIPMYADIFGTLPIAEALVFKGVGIGTVLAFMMAVTALSLPSMIMIKKVVKTKLLLMFIGIITFGILLMGYLFNAFSHLLI